MDQGDHHYVASIGANSVTGMGAFSCIVLEENEWQYTAYC